MDGFNDRQRIKALKKAKCALETEQNMQSGT